MLLGTSSTRPENFLNSSAGLSAIAKRRRGSRRANVVRHFMARFILIASFLVMGLFLQAQLPDTFIVSTTEIKFFMNETRQLLYKRGEFRLSDKPHQIITFLENISANDSLFTKADRDFIMNQVKQRKNPIWSDIYIDSTIFIKSKEIDSIFENFKVSGGWKVFYETYGPDFYEMSLPYFTKNKKTCIIYISNHCGGLCGGGCVRIFRLENDHWKLYKKIDCWAS